jgi:DNA-binding transcriptional LysR family regulator
MNREPDWALWRSFSAVVANGSLSGAARELGISQPTVGRHIETLEADLGLALFERGLTGLKPNVTALRLYEPVAQAQASLAEAAIMAEGAQDDLGGTVRITASVVISNYVLPALLVPTQLELVTRHLGKLPIIPTAHQDYLARRGTPAKAEDLYGHDMIGLDRSDLIIAHARSIGLPLVREQFLVRTDDQAQMWELLKAGLGIGFAQASLVRSTPGMVALPLDLAIPPLEVWLTTHRELFTSHRIRAIYDALAEGLSTYINA